MVETQNVERDPYHPGRLIIISGATAAGKNTVTQQLIESSDLPLERIVTMTTRPPRPGEEEGKDYHFVKPEQFAKTPVVTQKQYNEYVYGTKAASLRRLFGGTNLVWNIDLSQLPKLSSIFQEAFSPEETRMLLEQTTVIMITAPPHFYVEHKKRFMGRNEQATSADFNRRIRSDAAALRDIRAQHIPLVIHHPENMGKTIPQTIEAQAMHPQELVINMVINEQGNVESTVNAVAQIIKATTAKVR